MKLAPALPLLLAVTSLTLAPSLQPQDTLSPIALRRFAEALEGTTALTSAFVIACRDSGYKVVGVVGTQSEAIVARGRAGGCYNFFGPYMVVDLTRGKAVRGCVHDGHTSNQDPQPLGTMISFVTRVGPSTTAGGSPLPPNPASTVGRSGLPSPAISPICPVSPFQISEIESMTLVTRLKDGRVHEMHMGPEVDALFLSVPAIDKFMVPYYARVLGVDSAAAMRQRIVRGLSR